MRRLSKFKDYGNRHLSKELLNMDTMKYLIDRYCKGKGLEIGPGSAPYCELEDTVYVDKFYNDDRFLSVDASSGLPFDNNKFDFVVSSHCLEHCPNTLKTLMEWIRVTSDKGILVLVLPHGERTFDKGRNLTTLLHHIEDWRAEVGENDSTHWDEFEKYSIPNYPHAWKNDARQSDGSFDFEWIIAKGHLHYHVWTQNEIIDVLKYLGCKILVCIEELTEREDSFVVIARIKK